MIAGLTHNMAFLFTPIIFLFWKNDSLNPGLIYISSCVFILFLIPFAAESKSNSETGVLAANLYVAVIIAILIVYLLINKLKLDYLFSKLFYLQLFFLLLGIISIFIMGGAQAKRIGMACLLFQLIPMVITIELKIKYRPSFRSMLMFFSIIPTLLFNSSLSMLLTVK
ncbi:membrane hypothetical protein [Gammaproteobacteria bacterium]